MRVGAKYYERLVRYGVEEGRRKREFWQAAIMVDGRPPGTAESSPEDRALELAAMIPQFPDIAANDPEQMKRLMKEIDKALGS